MIPVCFRNMYQTGTIHNQHSLRKGKQNFGLILPRRVVKSMSSVRIDLTLCEDPTLKVLYLMSIQYKNLKSGTTSFSQLCEPTQVHGVGSSSHPVDAIMPITYSKMDLEETQNGKATNSLHMSQEYSRKNNLNMPDETCRKTRSNKSYSVSSSKAKGLSSVELEMLQRLFHKHRFQDTSTSWGWTWQKLPIIRSYRYLIGKIMHKSTKIGSKPLSGRTKSKRSTQYVNIITMPLPPSMRPVWVTQSPMISHGWESLSTRLKSVNQVKKNLLKN